jgi:hypothetical protein
MTTNKRRVAAYIEPQISDALDDWIDSMPEVSESQALNIILAEYFNLSKEVLGAKNTSNLRKIIRAEVLSILEEIDHG